MKDAYKVEKINLDFVSDLNSALSNYEEEENLLSEITGRHEKSTGAFKSEKQEIEADEKDEIFTFRPPKENNSKNNHEFLEFEVPQPAEDPDKVEEIKRRKVLIIHEHPQRKPVPWKHQCPFCSKPLEKETSERLACSHLFHPSCALKMRLRNRFECDLC